MTITEERHQTMLRFINNQSREIETLRKALEFYADPDLYGDKIVVTRFGVFESRPQDYSGRCISSDRGTIARKTLGLEK